MQITIQFGATSTLQEWSNFKGQLNRVKNKETPLLKNANNTEDFISHLTKQLQKGALIKGL